MYLADVLLLCTHVASLTSDPALPRDSHFLYGAHPLRGVEVAGIVTHARLSSGDKALRFVLDDGTGASVQGLLYTNGRGASQVLQLLRLGDAVVATGTLSWGYPVSGASDEYTRELRALRIRQLRGAGGGLNELCAWWVRAAQLHAQVYCKPLCELLPSCAPFTAVAPVAQPRAALEDSGRQGGAASSSTSSLPVSSCAGGAAGGGALGNAPRLLPLPLQGNKPQPQLQGGPAGGGSCAGGGAAQKPKPLPPDLFSRLVMVLQNVLDMHHPLTKGSALAVSVSQAASRKRARELIAARRLAAGGGEPRGGESEAEEGDEGNGSDGGAGEGGGGVGGWVGKEGEDGEEEEEEEDAEEGMEVLEARRVRQEARHDALLRQEQQGLLRGTLGSGVAASSLLQRGDPASDAETVLDEDDAQLVAEQKSRLQASSSSSMHPSSSSGATQAEISAAFERGQWVFSVGVMAPLAAEPPTAYQLQAPSSLPGATFLQHQQQQQVEEHDMVLVSTVAHVLPARHFLRAGGSAGVGIRDAGAPVAAFPSSFPSAISAPLIPESFTVQDATALLEATEPGVLGEIRGLQRKDGGVEAASVAVHCAVSEALQSLVSEGVVCACGVSPASQKKFTMVTQRHLISPETIRVLRIKGAFWDGMVGQEPGEGGAHQACVKVSEVELVKELRQRVSLKSVPIAVLRGAWKVMEEEAVLIKPTPYSFALQG